MTTEGLGEGVPHRRGIPHYHGDAVRTLFIIAAVVIIFAQSTGADLPLSSFSSVVTAVVLVVAAGITNPVQKWIHWLNALLAVAGTVIFGTAAVEQYRSGMDLLTLSFTFVEAIALISLIALYYTTASIRGLLQRPKYIRD